MGKLCWIYWYLPQIRLKLQLQKDLRMEPTVTRGGIPWYEFKHHDTTDYYA